jgi:hypothetical protein
MSQMAVEYYLEHIRQDYGNDRLRRAVHALGLRIKYMEDNDISAVKYRELYDKWNTR